MRTTLTRILVAMATLGFLALPDRLHACAVCFGDPSSPLVQGAKYGVIVLASFIYVILFTMAGIAFVWYRRAKALELAESSGIEST
jgi:hypothetical protein